MDFFPQRLRKDIQTFLGDNPLEKDGIDPAEIEISFGEYSIGPKPSQYSGGPKSSQYSKNIIPYEISGNTYNRVLIEFKKKFGSPEKTDITDSMNDPKNKDVRKSYDNIKKTTKWILKERISKHDDEKYRLRFRLSTEREIKEIHNFKPGLTRRKHRNSYIIDNISRIDLTKVESGENITYELELEIIGRQIDYQRLNKNILDVLRTLQNTNIVYSIIQYKEVISRFNNSLKREGDKFSDYRMVNSFMYNPRNLHYNDMVYGGLVGNPNENYRVAHKTDGLRKFLIMTDMGLYLVYPPYEVNFLTGRTIKQLVGYIIEGELVLPNMRILRSDDGADSITMEDFREMLIVNRENADYQNMLKRRYKGAILSGAQPYWFIAFDTLHVPGWNNSEGILVKGKEIQKRSHPERINAAADFKRILMSEPDDKWKEITAKLFLLSIKEFKKFDNSEEFFRVMREVISLENSLAYKTDGYIFMPINMPYDSGNDKISLRERILTKNADICKYKPGNKMTIDLAIKWVDKYDNSNDNSDTGQRLQLLSSGYSSSGRSLVPFNGSINNTLTNAMIDPDQDLIQNLVDGTVVEYEWNEEKGKLQALRVRYDKPYPNKIEFAQDNWGLMFDPIPLELLEGSTLKLLRKYHNKIKKGLFDESTERFHRISGTKMKPNLLDIGSGRGGDVFKWKNFERVIAVEPNEQHIESLKKKIAVIRKQENIEIIENIDDVIPSIQSAKERSDGVIVVKCGGEDTALITEVVKSFFDNSGGKSDVVSMMLSLSFFWQTGELLDQLIETITTNISSTGEFMFLTINGDSVEEMFRPRFGKGYEISELFMGPPGDNSRTVKMRVDLPNREVKIHLRDTIVGTETEEQTEWLVRIDDLRIRLGRKGFGLKYLERADKEEFMTQSEKIFTKMYSYGKFYPLKETNIPRIKTVTPKFHPSGSSLSSKMSSFSGTSFLEQEPRRLDSERTSIEFPGSPMSPSRMTTGRSPQRKDYELLDVYIPDPVKSPESGKMLPNLKVDPRRIDRRDGKAFGDDEIEEINCMWYRENPVVRIGTIGDGSCLVHSVLKSYYPPYAENPSYHVRTGMARQLRKDLANSLEQTDPDNPEMTYYESFSNFQNFVGSSEFYELSNLKKTLDSDGFLGDEAFSYMSQRLGIDTVIVIPYTEDLVQVSGGEMDSEYTVFVGHVGGCHYETLGVIIPNQGIQTVFDVNDSFMIAYRGYRVLSEIRSLYNNILEKIKIYQRDMTLSLPRSASDLEIRELLSFDDGYRILRQFLDRGEESLANAQQLYEKTTGGSDIETLDSMFDIRDEMNVLVESIRDIVDIVDIE